MNWLEEYAKGSFSLYAGNTISGFQPLDFFHFYGIWYDLWLERIVVAMDKIKAEDRTYDELKNVLPTPSNLRALIQKAIPAYIGSGRNKNNLYKTYTNFIARMLMEACPADPFGKSSTPLHTDSELKRIIENTQWQGGTPEEARALGKLVTAAGSLVHGLYNDVVTDFGWDTYGPYPGQEKGGQKFTLMIRNFPDLKPAGIWSEEFLAPIKNLKIYQLYQDVEWSVGFVGCHTLVKSGDPIRGLKYFSVVADEKVLDQKNIGGLAMELAQKAEKIYKEIRKKDFEALKQMVMLQECYQLKGLFDLANMDWKPTVEMLESVKGKPLLQGILPQDVMMTSLEEYKEVFHFKEFEGEVLR